MDATMVLAILVLVGTYGLMLWCAWSGEGIRYMRLHLPPFYEKWLRRTRKARYPDRVFRVGLHQGKGHSYLVSIRESQGRTEINVDVFETRNRWGKRMRPLCLKRHQCRIEI